MKHWETWNRHGIQDVLPIARKEFMRTSLAQEAKGLKKYPNPLRTWNGRDPFEDLRQELADGWHYVTWADMQYKNIKTLCKGLGVLVVALAAALAWALLSARKGVF